MLKELARLNQELRVQKPYNPTTKDHEKRLAEDRAWSANTRGQGGFLKRGGGVGGGNVPSTNYGRVKQSRQGFRSSSDNARSGSPNHKKGIRALIVDHLKSQIKTTDDAHNFLENLNSKGKTPKVEVYDVLSKYRKEEKEQFIQR